MTNILIFSDIHYPTRLKNPKILDILEELTKRFDIVIGCGDYVNENIIYLIQNISKKHYLVKGNMDFFDKNIAESLFIEIEKLKIGIIHGEGSPFGIESRIIRRFTVKPDIIFYGHTHLKENKIINNIHFVNPGAFCDGNYCTAQIKEKNVKIEFLKITF